jgi:cytidylate kinase
MSEHTRVAIDGPVASGKSTLGRQLAATLGYLYLDTGSMYRGLTALALARGLDPEDEAAITALARSLHLDFPPAAPGRGAGDPPLLADGIDISTMLRTPEVERHVSAVSRHAGVREALVARQRAIAGERSVVMVGRDIGTVVLPDAEVKIFLDAGVEERARRRHEERIAAGREDDLQTTLEELRRRDKLDSERAISPLRQAEDAVRVDTTGLSPAQSLALLLGVVRRHRRDGAR